MNEELIRKANLIEEALMILIDDVREIRGSYKPAYDGTEITNLEEAVVSKSIDIAEYGLKKAISNIQDVISYGRRLLEG